MILSLWWEILYTFEYQIKVWVGGGSYTFFKVICFFFAQYENRFFIPAKSTSETNTLTNRDKNANLKMYNES